MQIDDLEKLERQLIPALNTVRTALGKPRAILPKSDVNELAQIHQLLNEIDIPVIVSGQRLTAYGRIQWLIENR